MLLIRWDKKDMILLILQDSNSMKDQNKWSEIVYICVSNVQNVNRKTKKKDLHRLWVQSALIFKWKKFNKINFLSWLFSIFEFTGWDAKNVTIMEKLKFMIANWKKSKNNFAKLLLIF